MSCSCKRLGCACSNPECANGWLEANDGTNAVLACKVCKPGWTPPEERRAAAAEAKARDEETRRRVDLAAAQLDSERQAAMFGGKQEPPEDHRHPVLGPND